MEQQLIDVNAVAKLLDVTPRTVFRMAASDLMPPGLKVGHSRRWRKSEIAAWIAGGCKPPSKAPPLRKAK